MLWRQDDPFKHMKVDVIEEGELRVAPRRRLREPSWNRVSVNSEISIFCNHFPL
jgi:hypothetical protein